MNQHTGQTLIIATACLFMFAMQAMSLWKKWNLPLLHGRTYFAGVPVDTGFYDGAGRALLRKIRGWMVALTLWKSGWWRYLPGYNCSTRRGGWC